MDETMTCNKSLENSANFTLAKLSLEQARKFLVGTSRERVEVLKEIPPGTYLEMRFKANTKKVLITFIPVYQEVQRLDNALGILRDEEVQRAKSDLTINNNSSHIKYDGKLLNDEMEENYIELIIYKS